MGKRNADAPTDDDGKPDEVAAAESAKVIADSQVATAKAKIIEENERTLERLNNLTRWTPPEPKRKRAPRKRASTSRSASSSK